MKKNLLALALSLLFSAANAQTSFEKGYFIKNTGERVDCLIRDMAWMNNPDTFEYKRSESGQTQFESLAGVREFQVMGAPKYVRAKVKMDLSTDNTGRLDSYKDIRLVEKEVFLRILVEGDAVLYHYAERELQRFFIRVDGSTPEQLIYKRYKKSSHEIAALTTYRQQLWNRLKCPDITRNSINKIAYKMNALVRLFERYNLCKNPMYVKGASDGGNYAINLFLRPGIRSTSLSASSNRTPFRDVDFGDKLGFGFGLELEVVLPFNRNKWSVILEPTYQAFKEEGMTETAGFTLTTNEVTVDYKSLEIPLGVRYHMFLSDKGKIFINAALVSDFPVSSHLTYANSAPLELGFNVSGAFGLGYKHNDRVSLEVRYLTDREVLAMDNFVSNVSRFGGFSLNFGYNIL